MQALILKDDGTQLEAVPENGKKFRLRELQKIVGGLIDIQRLPKSKKIIVVNDDGKLIGKPVNKEASALWQFNYPLNNDGLIVGTVLVCDRGMIG